MFESRFSSRKWKWKEISGQEDSLQGSEKNKQKPGQEGAELRCLSGQRPWKLTIVSFLSSIFVNGKKDHHYPFSLGS